MRVHGKAKIRPLFAIVPLFVAACGGGADPTGTTSAADQACPEYAAATDVSAFASLPVGADVRAFLEGSWNVGVAAGSIQASMTRECIAFATDLGAPDTWSSIADPAQQMAAACAAVSAQLGAVYAMYPATCMHVSWQPPTCAPRLDIQAHCEAECMGQVSVSGGAGAGCQIGYGASCGAGASGSVQVSGQCSASCSASASASSTCTKGLVTCGSSGYGGGGWVAIQATVQAHLPAILALAYGQAGAAASAGASLGGSAGLYTSGDGGAASAKGAACTQVAAHAVAGAQASLQGSVQAGAGVMAACGLHGGGGYGVDAGSGGYGLGLGLGLGLGGGLSGGGYGTGGSGSVGGGCPPTGAGGGGPTDAGSGPEAAAH